MDYSLFKFEFKAMGGMNELQFYSKSLEDAEQAAQVAIADVKRIEKKYSRYRRDSVVSKINNARGTAIAVDEETAHLLHYADACYSASNGLFDITAGVLRHAWDFSSTTRPRKIRINRLLPHVGWRKVRWREPYVRLPHPEMEIDFGGFGKEFAVDRCAEILSQAGVRHGLVNFAGDVHVLGPHPNGSPWIVGIQHPRKERSVISRIALFRGAVATSGDYERYMEVNGKRYCHIINPQTGQPVQDLQAVSVVASSCLLAGTAATITMLFGEKQGCKFLKKGGMSHLLVTRTGKLRCSPAVSSQLLTRETQERESYVN